MASPAASYPRKVQIAPDSAGSAGTYADLGLQAKYDVDKKSDNADISQQNSAGWHIKLQTLKGAGISLEYFTDGTDTAQATLDTGWSTGAQVWVKVFKTASTGEIFPCLVDSIKDAYDPAQPLKTSTALSSNGARTTF